MRTYINVVKVAEAKIYKEKGINVIRPPTQ